MTHQVPLNRRGLPKSQGLYNPENEHDSCGIGFLANIKGKKSHSIIKQGLQILENLSHRGAVGADPLAGDGAGILIQIPDAFMRTQTKKINITLPKEGEYGVLMIFLPHEKKTREKIKKHSKTLSHKKVRSFWAGAMSQPIIQNLAKMLSQPNRTSHKRLSGKVMTLRKIVFLN